MLKSIVSQVNKIIDYLLPPRTNFDIVRKLKEDDIISLPKSEKIADLDWIHPLFKYQDKKVRAIIWELKYRNNILPLETIGKLMFDEILAIVSDILIFDSKASFLLIPIPITNTKRRERGYNQAEYICRSIIQNDLERILLYAPQWFTKIKETEAQSHSHSKEERQKNLLGVFSANEQVEGKYIILVDDVVTTGSTLSEARHTLLSQGSSEVLAFTIAH